MTPGHSNRVFSLNFNPDDDNIILTGGWDNTVQIWDIRVSHAVRLIYGPHIAGDSVDIHDGVVMTGSWRPEHQLEVRINLNYTRRRLISLRVTAPACMAPCRCGTSAAAN
jgi:WD40 repeat protein